MSGIVSGYFGQFVAANAGIFVLGWVLFGLVMAVPSLFVRPWSWLGWTVTATRSASSSVKAAVREVLAEQKGATP